MRLLGSTLRVRFEDQGGLLTHSFPGPIIWAFWHNRILAMVRIYEKHLSSRRGVVLTSPSKDGEILAGVIARFGVGAVRGSSSRRGSAALLELTAKMKSGLDVVITPDGPRGPRYHLHPGAVKLAELTGAPVIPVHVYYASYWELRSWDGFRIPKPFSRVSVVLDEPFCIPSDITGEAFEAERLRLEEKLRSGNGELPTSFTP